MPRTLPALDVTGPLACPSLAAGPLDPYAALHVALRLTALADPALVRVIDPECC